MRGGGGGGGERERERERERDVDAWVGLISSTLERTNSKVGPFYTVTTDITYEDGEYTPLLLYYLDIWVPV